MSEFKLHTAYVQRTRRNKGWRMYGDFPDPGNFVVMAAVRGRQEFAGLGTSTGPTKFEIWGTEAQCLLAAQYVAVKYGFNIERL